MQGEVRGHRGDRPATTQVMAFLAVLSIVEDSFLGESVRRLPSTPGRDLCPHEGRAPGTPRPLRRSIHMPTIHAKLPDALKNGVRTVPSRQSSEQAIFSTSCPPAALERDSGH